MACGGLRAGAGLIGAVMLLSACATTPGRVSGTDGGMEGQFFYDCANGDRVEVRFTSSTGTAALIRGTEQKELQRKPTFRGFAYAAGDTSIQGSGDVMQIAVPGFPPLDCRLER